MISSVLSRLRREKLDWEDRSLIMSARCLMASDIWRKTPDFGNPLWLSEKGFGIYSQFDDDGIIQFLIYFLGIDNFSKKFFIEFGVGDFFESNCHFLLVNNSWDGCVIDGDIKNIKKLRSTEMFWRYNIDAICDFITVDNINATLRKYYDKDLGVLHIDLDGNDYWILSAIELGILDPDILILEYNAIFGSKMEVTVPYHPQFDRSEAHFSCKYFGASLAALVAKAEESGYYFVGCNRGGNNAYFLAERYLNDVPPTSISQGFVNARFRESRDFYGRLNFLSAEDVLDQIKDLELIDVSK